jgi:hypothetical protein
MNLDQVSKTHYKVSDFVGWAKSKTLILSPSFQRRAVWPAGAKSFLIDTIVRGLPIPILFLREQKTDLNTLEPKREVVDGQQRMRTVLTFIIPSSLSDYHPAKDDFTIRPAHNKALANLPFSKLPSEIRQKILDYQFSVHVFPSSVEDREILQIFARMNSTGLKVNAQELRNAEYYGDFKTSMYLLAAEQLPRWRTWGIFSETQISRMLEVELTSELAQMMLVGIVGKTQKAIDTLYKDNDDTWRDQAEVEKRFRFCMDGISSAFQDELLNTAFSNRSAFYALFAVIYQAAFGLGSSLKRVRGTAIPSTFKGKALKISDLIVSGKAPSDVLESLARRTTHPDSRHSVVNYFIAKLL